MSAASRGRAARLATPVLLRRVMPGLYSVRRGERVLGEVSRGPQGLWTILGQRSAGSFGSATAAARALVAELRARMAL